jgi:hypothetical protein
LCVPGLPDGLFSNQKSQFGGKLQGGRLENVDIFNGHLEYFSWILYDHLAHLVFIWYIFSSFGIMHQQNLATPCVTACQGG